MKNIIKTISLLVLVCFSFFYTDKVMNIINQKDPLMIKIESLKEDGEVIGNRTRVKVVKNKVAPPFREAEFDIIYGKGISKEGNILDAAVNLDIVEKSGSWFSYNGDRIGQGRENVKDYLAKNPKVAEEIEGKIRANYEKAFEKSLGEEENDPEQDTEPSDDEE